MDIVEESNKTLLRAEQNDPKLKSLTIRNRNHTTGRIRGCFWLHDGADLSRLGNAITNNTNLKKISFYKSSERQFNKTFFKVLKRNATITQVCLKGGIDNNILSKYVANNGNLTEITIHRGDVRGGGVAGSLIPAIKKCQNLNNLSFSACSIDDASLKDIVLGIRGLSRLEKLYLWRRRSSDSDIGIGSAESIVSLLQDPSCNLISLDLDRIGFNNECIQIIASSLRANTKLKRLSLSGSDVGSSGCDALGTLLKDPTCNLTALHLGGCSLDNECILKIVTSLIGNTKLEQLDLSGNKLKRSGCESIATLLQDTNSNINTVDLYVTDMTDEFVSLLAQALVGNNKLKYMDLSGNSGITKAGWNAFSTILSNCSNHTLLDFGNGNDIENMPAMLSTQLKLNLAVDMDPLLELDTEDDERKPKALPSVVDWFGRIKEFNQNEEVVKCINARKLSAIYQFARAMPLKFVPASPFTHPSVVSLIQLKDGMSDALKTKNKELQQRNTELEKEIATKEAEMQDAKKKSEDVLKAKEEEIKDLHMRLDSIGSLTKRRKYG